MKETTSEEGVALARKAGLIVQELPDEVLVYDLHQDKAHCLNSTAAFVWNHCDGRASVGEIAQLMEKEWQTPVSEDAVWFTLNKLSKAELLQERITLPKAKVGMSRRSAVRRLGFGALLTIPIVASVVAPTAVSAASFPSPCLVCVVDLSDPGESCPAECGPTVLCQCYRHSNCGGGRFAGKQSCAACKARAVSPLSWSCP